MHPVHWQDNGHPIHTVYIDLHAAFDSLSRSLLGSQLNLMFTTCVCWHQSFATRLHQLKNASISAPLSTQQLKPLLISYESMASLVRLRIISL